MRITAKGQVTTPQEVRDSAGLMREGSRIHIEAGGVRLLKTTARRPQNARSRAAREFPVAATSKMTADDVGALMRAPRRLRPSGTATRGFIRRPAAG